MRPVPSWGFAKHQGKSGPGLQAVAAEQTAIQSAHK